MNKQIITFSADEQKLVKTGGINCYASNIVSYIEAHFALGQNWSGYDSVRAVWSNDNNMTVISTVLDSNGHCIVPFEVLKTMGVVMVNLVGSISVSGTLTDRLTTFPCEALTVARKAKINGSETAPITPSQFEQFIAIVISEVEKVTGMTAEAETLPAGSSATARYEDGVLYLGIPQGIQGERGETGEDGNGIAQVLYNSDYSITFVFTNGERFTTPSLRGETGPQGQPGQDGRDGTDGADGVTPSLSVGTVTTLPSTEDAYVTRRGTDENPVFDFGIPQGPKGDKGEQGEVSLEQLSELLPTDTASGAIASFPDGQSVIPALSVKAEIEPIQSGSGTPSPDNVRPISGHTECVTIVCGVNLLDPSEKKWLEDSNMYFYREDGIVLPSGTYTLSYKGEGNISGLYASYYPQGSGNIGLVYNNNKLTFALAESTRLLFNFYDVSHKLADDMSLYQLEVGTIATDYEPYNGTTHTTTLGRTVYGGTLDVVSGVLVVDRAMVDLGTLTWAYNGSVKFFQASLSNIAGVAYTAIPNLICSNYEAGSIASVRDGSMTGVSANISGYVYARDPNYTDAQSFKTAMSGVQLCYELASPQTYQLTPTEVALLKGQNNVWTDSGEVEVTYKADVGLYIDKKLNV